jgi:hypothetical protein
MGVVQKRAIFGNLEKRAKTVTAKDAPLDRDQLRPGPAVRFAYWTVRVTVVDVVIVALAESVPVTVNR